MLSINNTQYINSTIKSNKQNIRFCSKTLGFDKFSSSGEVTSNSEFSESVKEKFSEKQLDKLTKKTPEFLDVYSQEKKLFNEKFPTNQREHIDYFISGTNKFSSSCSVKETVAEINAILNSCNDVEKYSLRSEYLQMYFPKTISKLAEIL